jgi:hypothetical protein
MAAVGERVGLKVVCTTDPDEEQALAYTQLA